MFGVSFSELMLIGAVALVIVGPNRLPAVLGTLGRWTAKVRRITTEMRHQSGIDDLLRKEGFSGGLNELRQLQNVARGGIKSLVASSSVLPNGSKTPAKGSASTSSAPQSASASGSTAGNANAKPYEDPYAHVPYDRSREYPSEGCDAHGALPDDLWWDPKAQHGKTNAVSVSSAASVAATQADPNSASADTSSPSASNPAAANAEANPAQSTQPAESSAAS